MSVMVLASPHVRQQTNIESDAIGTMIVFCPEKCMMRADMRKRRMKLVIEGPSTWIFKGKKETFENLRNSLG